jgi:aminomethyltransferase
MVDFGGWDMPVNYGSQIEEHHAVRRDAGSSTSRTCRWSTSRARTRARSCAALANNVDKLKARARRSTRACSTRGRRRRRPHRLLLREDFFRLVVNAGTAEKDIAWLAGCASAARGHDHAAARPRDHRGPGTERAREILEALPGLAARREPLSRSTRRVGGD